MPVLDDVIHERIDRPITHESPEFVYASAKSRILPMYERRGIDAEFIKTFALWEKRYNAALTPATDDLTALVEATAEPIVAPALLDNARTERARRMAVAR